MQGIYNAFLSLTGLPLVVIDSVAHHCPGYGRIDTKSQAVHQLANDVDHKVKTRVVGRNDKQTQSADDGEDRSKYGELLLSKLNHHLARKGSKQKDGDHGKELNDTRDLGVFKVDLEGNGNCGCRALHTDKHTHGGNGSAYRGTVFDKVSKCRKYVEFRLILVDLLIHVHADLGISDHELEAEEAQHTHNQGRNEHHVSVEGFILVVDQEGQDHHGEHISDHGANGSPSGEGGSVSGLLGDQGKQRAVGDVCDGVKGIPNHVTGNKDNKFSPNGSTGERQEAARAAYDQAKGTNKNVLQKFVSLVLVAIRVDHRTDQRVVNGVPHLNDDQKQRIPRAHAHDLRPEQRHRALQGKAHVTAKVTCRVRNAVADTEFPLAVGIKFQFLFHCTILFIKYSKWCHRAICSHIV